MATLLDAIALAAFRTIDGSLAWFDRNLREAGLESSITVVGGESGPELRVTVDQLGLRVWMSDKGPACRVGPHVLAYVWARFDFEAKDRPIGVVYLMATGTQWRALLKGDLPATGTVRMAHGSWRDGYQRLVELIDSLVRKAAQDRWHVTIGECGGEVTHG